MTNEEIRKRFEFDTEFLFKNSNLDEMYFVCPINKIGKFLYFLEHDLGYKRKNAIFPRGYRMNVIYLAVCTKSKCLIRFEDYVDGSIRLNPVPEYIKEYEINYDE